MKVNVTKASHYIKLNGVLTELNIGEQDIEDKTASSMIDNGYAVEVEVKKTEAKKTTTKK